jgi:hypothetical protein
MHHSLKPLVCLIAGNEAKGAVDRQACLQKVGEIEKKPDDMLLGDPSPFLAFYGLDSHRIKPAGFELPCGVGLRDRFHHSTVYLSAYIPRLVLEKTHKDSVTGE